MCTPHHSWHTFPVSTIVRSGVCAQVFLEAAAPVTGMTDTFDVWYGGSDAVIGTARVKVTKV